MEVLQTSYHAFLAGSEQELVMCAVLRVMRTCILSTSWRCDLLRAISIGLGALHHELPYLNHRVNACQRHFSVCWARRPWFPSGSARFMTVTDGVSWEKIVAPLSAMSLVWTSLFLFYVANSATVLVKWASASGTEPNIPWFTMVESSFFMINHHSQILTIMMQLQLSITVTATNHH